MKKRPKTSTRTSPTAAPSASQNPDLVSPIKRGRGRPGHVPTKETRAAVESLSGMGHCQEDICSALGLGSTNTLAKHYGLELRMGRIKANDNVAKSLYKQAIDGNTTAGIWWEKTRAGKSDRHEITGKDGGPIATANQIDWSKLSDADLENLTRLLGNKIVAPQPEPGGPAPVGASGANPTRH